MKKSIAKLIGRLYYLSWAIIVIGGVLFINKIEVTGVIVTSIGGFILTLNYLINMIIYQPAEEVDWSLVYPELAGVEKPEDTVNE